MDPVAQTVSRLTSPRSFAGMTGFQAAAESTREFQLTKELEDRWFLRQQRAEQLRKMREDVMGARAGAQAIDRLSQLDPSSEDYFTQAQSVLAETPEALTDRKVSAFLGLQHQTAQLAQRERDYQRQNIFNLGRDKRILEREEEEAVMRDRVARENKLSEFERSLAPGTHEDSAYRIALKKMGGDTFEKKERAMESALTSREEWDRYMKFIEGKPIPADEMDSWRGTSEEDGGFRFNEDKAVRFFQKIAVDKAQQESMEKRVKHLQGYVRYLNQLTVYDEAQRKQKDEDLANAVEELRGLEMTLNPGLKARADERKSGNQKSENGSAQPNATGSGKPGGKPAVRDARAPDDE